ncbi:MAG: hypothetical protein HDR56_00690 [Treponema sp.]|nr:hypothetical protein [Treponema sp.]
MTMGIETLYKSIQEFLTKPPVIIWGAGATVAYGLPSMKILNELLKKEFDFFNENNNNLEEELGNSKYEKYLFDIRKSIWKIINTADEMALGEIISTFSKFAGVEKMVKKFLEPHPNNLTIITTNYDRILENVMAKLNIDYTDGFYGKLLSVFDYNQLSVEKTNCVRLLKVHGSLNWFNVDGEVRYFKENDIYEPLIIPPGKNKYRQAFEDPYRTIIQFSDNVIKNAECFLIVGFGFNDEHITPEIILKTKYGCPIVLVTKKITDSAKELLKDARKYLFLEEATTGGTVVTIKNGDNVISEIFKCEELWMLDKFMEVF